MISNDRDNARLLRRGLELRALPQDYDMLKHNLRCMNRRAFLVAAGAAAAPHLIPSGVLAAPRKHNRVVQVGSQGRSAKPAHDACTFLRNGMLGKVGRVVCWHDPCPTGGTAPDSPAPPELDWDLWLGPLRWRPYNAAYCPADFRWIMESGGGQIRDRGAHVMSVILWCMDADYNMNHKEDWFRAIKTGRKPCMEIETGHRVATMCNLGNISYLLGRKLHWNGAKEQVAGDDQANRLLSRPQRHPYHL